MEARDGCKYVMSLQDFKRRHPGARSRPAAAWCGNRMRTPRVKIFSPEVNNVAASLKGAFGFDCFSGAFFLCRWSLLLCFLLWQPVATLLISKRNNTYNWKQINDDDERTNSMLILAICTAAIGCGLCRKSSQHTT